MKRVLFIVIVLALSVLANAQTVPQTITGINVEPHDSAWYAEQSEAWLKEARQNPQNELAWKNYFMATTYMARCSEGDTTSIDAAMNLLEENIKDTYTYNYCKYRQLRGRADVPVSDADAYAYKAMKMLPEKKDFFDYDILTYFCAIHDDCPLLKTIAREYYNSGICSPYALDYSRNELRSIPSNALYIGSADVDIIPKWVLQYGNDEFTGVYCIMRDALTDSVYLSKVCRDLGIKEKFTFQNGSYYSALPDGYYARLNYLITMHDILKFLQEKSGRPLYFSRFNPISDAPWNDYLYVEGLVYKYSTEDYANDDVYINNLEHVYDLAAMMEPAKDDIWDNSNQLAAQYIFALNTVLYAYAERKDKEHAKWAYNMIQDIVKGLGWPDDYKEELQHEGELLYQCAKKGIDPSTIYDEEE